MIFFKEFKLNPPVAPKAQDEIIRIIKIKDSLEEKIRVRGAIFCQVNKIAPWVQLISSITWGNQKWVGAIPALIPSEIEIKLLWGETRFVEENLARVRPEKMITTEARAWVIKYLIAASDLDGVGDTIRNGMKDIKLISKANQTITQEEDEQATRVLPIKVEEITK
jgi:hypothetical protein